MPKNAKQMAFFEEMKKDLCDEFDEEDILADIKVLMETPSEKITSFIGAVHNLEDSGKEAEVDRRAEEAPEEDYDEIEEAVSNDDSIMDEIFRTSVQQAGENLGISVVSFYLFDYGSDFPDD